MNSAIVVRAQLIFIDGKHFSIGFLCGIVCVLSDKMEEGGQAVTCDEPLAVQFIIIYISNGNCVEEPENTATDRNPSRFGFTSISRFKPCSWGGGDKFDD